MSGINMRFAATYASLVLFGKRVGPITGTIITLALFWLFWHVS